MENIATQTQINRSPRKRYTPEQRQQVLERFHQSGLRQREFVAREGISQAALGKWLQNERQQAKGPGKLVRFETLELPHSSPHWAAEIVSPSHWTLRLAQAPPATVLQALVRALPC